MLSETAGNVMLDALTALIDTVTIHSDDPGLSGLSRLPVTPQPVSWAKAQNWAVASDMDVSFDVPACTVSYVGYWSDGEFFGGRALDHAQQFSTPGVYRIPAGGLVETLV